MAFMAVQGSLREDLKKIFEKQVLISKNTQEASTLTHGELFTIKMETESRHCENSISYRVKWDLLCALLLTAFCIFLFWKTIFEGHLLFGSDFVGFYQGMKQFLYDQVHDHGSIPYWNPYIFGGMPFWAHLESTIFYPLDFLFWFMAPETAFGYTMFIHIMLAALFMYALLRSLGTGPSGSFVGAAVFTGNGFIMATLYDGQMFRVQAYIWLPLIIFSAQPGAKTRKFFTQRGDGRPFLGLPDPFRFSTGCPLCLDGGLFFLPGIFPKKEFDGKKSLSNRRVSSFCSSSSGWEPPPYRSSPPLNSSGFPSDPSSMPMSWLP